MNYPKPPQSRNIRKLFSIKLVVVIVALGAGLITAVTGFTAAVSSRQPKKVDSLSPSQVDSRSQRRQRWFAGKELWNNIEQERMSNIATAGQRIGQENRNSGDPGSTNGVDPTFNISLEDGYTRVEIVAVQPDGKVLVGGSFQIVDGVRQFGLARLNSDGTRDTSFNTGNIGPNNTVFDIEVLTDGDIMIGGAFTAFNGISRNRIARLSQDGTLDTTFDPGSGSNGVVVDILVQPNEKLVVGGQFTAYNGVNVPRIVRLNGNGSIDSSFTPPTINTTVQALSRQSDGRIVIAGSFTLVDGLTRRGIARLNADGTHDTSFDALTNVNAGNNCIAIQPDGKLLVGGAYNGGTLVRLNGDGSLDAGFSVPIVTGSTVHQVIILSGGKLLVAGYFDDGQGNGYGVVRLNSDGSVDGTFEAQVSDTTFLEVFSIALTPGGKIAGGGDVYHLGDAQSKHVFLANSNGTIDTAFATEIEGVGSARVTVRQTDGKTLIGGSFRRVNGSPLNNLVRINTDGTYDETFVGDPNGEVYSLAIQPDGKILVGGRFLLFNGEDTGSAVRINTNGTIDDSFILPADVETNFLYKVLLQPDGKIIGTGLIVTPRSGNGATAVYRVNADGSDDTGFALANNGGVVTDAALLSDGKIYIGGFFTNFAGSGINKIARLNANGTLDGAFNTGTGTANSVYSVATQSDGKVLFGGFLTTVAGQYAAGIVRLNADGTPDQGFDPGLGANGGVYDIFVQPDNKIMIGGFFSLFNNVARSNLARLNSDGSLDTSFTDQTNSYIWNINQDPDGKTLISGGFISVNGTEKLGVARLSETDLTPPGNDNFASAAVITGISGTTGGNNTNATAEAGEPAHAEIAAAHSVWYRWTAPDTGLFSFTTVGSSFDTTLGVYTGSSVSTLTAVASNDDSAAFDPSSRVVFHADEGTEYFIAIDRKNDSAGIVNMIWRQAARTYRIYAQTGNGNISPRVPTIVATRTSDNSQYVAQNISPGVFELDLPVDNATYVVSIGGADTWSPNSFILDNSGRPGPRGENPNAGGFNLVTVATTVSATVSGVLQGVTGTEGVTVFLGSESGPNPIAPIPCAVALSGSLVVYSCQFIVDTRHQIKPSLNGIVFTPVNRRYPIPVTVNVIPGPGSMFTAASGATYNISGQVTADGNPLLEATVFLTGSKTHSYSTAADGNYSFNNLPAGGTYMVSVAYPGYNFLPQTVEDLQSNRIINMAAQGGCSYSLSAPGTSVPANGGEGTFIVNTTSGCPWAVANSASWITINNGTGNGTGPVYFTAQPNGGNTREGSIIVGGQTFTVSQDSNCTFVGNLVGSPNFPAAGGSGSINISASDPGCVLTPSATDYCMVDPGGSTIGNDPVNFTISPNHGVARSAAINIGGQAVNITQDAAAGTHRARFDFDGDGRSDISVYRPSTGFWYFLKSTAGFDAVPFGLEEDIPVAADYDGDGKTDIAVLRPSSNYWYRIDSSTGQFVAGQFGGARDIPVPADYDGDGHENIAIFRPSTGTWYTSLDPGSNYGAVQWGADGDIPMPADYDGDGKTDVAVFRPSTGIWYMLNSLTGFNALQFGTTDDIPVAADYDGDGKADIAVYRPSNTVWYRLNSSSGQFAAYQFGSAGDKPVAADYSGDKSADIAVFRPSNGGWYIWSCTNNTAISATLFGYSTDIPVPFPIAP